MVNCPDELASTLNNEGLENQISIQGYQTGGVLMFVRNITNLNVMIEAFLLDEQSGNHWIAFPKRASKILMDLGRYHGWDNLTAKGWIPVRQISLNDQWSALRFLPRANVKEIKRGTDYPRIDRKTKTVSIPEVLDDRLKQAGLTEVFKALSFTNRKEAVISILEAKKPETLEKRLDKILKSLT